MIPAEIRIEFDNLIHEAKWHFHGGNFAKADRLFREVTEIIAKQAELAALREGDAA